MELIGSLNCGSIIAEMALALIGLPCTTTDIPYLREGPERDRLRALNPLGQVPTLILDDGAIMTESAAIILYLNDLKPDARLLPPPGDINRPLVLNRLIWLVAAIYPTFTYGDDPGKWTLPGDGAHTLRQRTRPSPRFPLPRLERRFRPRPPRRRRPPLRARSIPHRHDHLAPPPPLVRNQHPPPGHRRRHRRSAPFPGSNHRPASRLAEVKAGALPLDPGASRPQTPICLA